MMDVFDQHGEEKLEEGSRVMLDGNAIVGTVTAIETGEHGARPSVEIEFDGSPPWKAVYDLKPLALEAPKFTSLGDGINQAMRAQAGQPS